MDAPMDGTMVIPPNVRCCVEDAHGNCVFVGDTVLASDGIKHVVRALEIKDPEHAWIVTAANQHLIPQLTKLLG